VARDTRVRWALEEVGLAYDVRLVSSARSRSPRTLSHSSSRCLAVASFARALEVAIQAGDQVGAMRLVKELRAGVESGRSAELPHLGASGEPRGQRLA